MTVRSLAVVVLFMGFASFSCTIPKSANPAAHPGGADSTAASGQGPQSESPPASVFELRDGSRIIGTLLLSSVPLVSSYGSVAFRPAEVTSIIATDSSAGVKVEFRNGDVLRGSLQVDSLAVQCAAGRINIPVTAILRVSPLWSESDVVEGLIARYPLRGNASDVTGRGHDGMNHGAVPAPDRFGRDAHALEFDGGNARISLPEGIIDPECGGCTLSLWVLTKPSRASRQALYIGAATAELSIYAASGQFAFGGELSDRQGFVTETPEVENTFVHLAGAYTRGKSIVLYLNGEKKSEAPVPDLPLNSGLQDYTSGIGAYSPDHPEQGKRFARANWFGRISDVRIYNRALSDREILSLYHSRD
jgi:hypothetical protein